jgi:hypothetical protein
MTVIPETLLFPVFFNLEDNEVKIVTEVNLFSQHANK